MDQRAKKILIDTFWSPTGWKDKKDFVTVKEDFEYAKSKGLMFDPEPIDHSEIIHKLQESLHLIDKRSVANAFLASLSSRRLDWRSALGSYAVFQHLPGHKFDEQSTGQCSVCGLYRSERLHDLNILNFERLKWGGVRHDQIVYAATDLKLFLQTQIPRPATDDIQIFRNLLMAISNVPVKVR